MADRIDRARDEQFMSLALNLAEKGVGRTHPNPTVGAVVVSNGEVVGSGWHEGPGHSHAEVVALENAGSQARGATLYVTLEPCAGSGKTPPCTNAILRAGIWRVVYASSDPNPKMAGGGEVLKSHGVEVEGGVLAGEADAINRPFFHYYRLGRGYVTAKAAISLDGKLATSQNQSKWITGKKARQHAHRLRAASDAIIVGAGTLIHDNPALTVRDAPILGAPPLRVVLCFETPRFSSDCLLLEGDAPARLYVRSVNEHTKKWLDAGVDVKRASSLTAILKHLASEGRMSVLLEGGGILHGAFLEARLTDELVLYQAPILIGGREATGLWQGIGAGHIDLSPRLVDVTRRKLGDDQMIRGRVVYPED